MDEEQQPDAIPWWQSKIVVGLAIAAVSNLVRVFHLTNYLTSDQISQLASAGLDIVGIASIAYAAKARLQQKHASPVTLTKSKAASINAAKQPTPPTETPQ